MSNCGAASQRANAGLPSAGVAQALVPAVSRLVSTPVADVKRCRTKGVPMSGDPAGMSACATEVRR